jgi:uncharacterized membrane protein (UPF0182 family)
MPRRQPRLPGRGRVLIILGIVVLFLLLTSLRGIAGFYTDYLWFSSLHRASVFRGILGAKVALAVIFTGAFFVMLLVNLVIADRLAPPFRPTGPDEEFLERYHDLVGGRMGLVRVVLSLLLALIAGAGVSSEWNSWILFTHGGHWGIKDAQFHKDLGFFVFKLPFLSFVSGWLFASLLIILIVTAVAHYLNGGIRMGSVAERVAPRVKVHLSVLLGLIAIVKAFGYWLQRYDLSVSSRGYVDGPGYTDVHAQLPAINLLLLISIAAFLLFIVNIWRRGWTLPVLGVSLWALVAVVAGAIYPQVVQRFSVTPNEPQKERPYIARNITATREALGVDSQVVTTSDFDLNTNKASINLADNQGTVRNIRIWDPSPDVLGKTFPQLQRTRDYYRVNDVDIDRYQLANTSGADDQTEVALSIRDLNTANVPQKSWAGKHLAYTHGYGAIVAPANAKKPSGEPDFIAKDIPYATNVPALKLDQPAVYFGENLSGYVVTNTKVDEIQYSGNKGTVHAEYKGRDGVKLGNILKRTAFALKFGDPDLIISKQLSGSSKILYKRDIRDRVQALAPFLHFDADPYPVIVGGRIKWVMDAYTTTDRYPYGETADTTQLDEASGLKGRFNYVRNSVKAVLDAYDGSVTYYVMPTKDPIIDAYRKAFPSLFTDFKKMPADIKAHLRYPEDMFRVQTNMWGEYHITNPSDFYSGDDRWDVSLDPGTAGAAQATRTTDAAGRVVSERQARIDPYYLFTQLPGATQPSFVLLRPFAPRATQDDNQVLTAFMVGQSDGKDYGKLKVYVMPRQKLPNGPALVQGEIQSNGDVSEQETLLSGSGSTVSYGSLIAVPIDNGIVWVRPFYVTSSQTEVPTVRKIIVDFNGDVVIRDTLQEALTAVFGNAPPTLEQGGNGGPAAPPPATPSGSVTQQVATLLSQAQALFDQADAALAAKDLAKYQDLTNQGRAKTTQAEQLLEKAGAGGSSSSSSSTTGAA